jgi:hypothetical protein
MKKEYNQQVAEIKERFGVDVEFCAVKQNPYLEKSCDKYNFEVTFTKDNKKSSFYFSQGYRKVHTHKGMKMYEYEHAQKKLDQENSVPKLFDLLCCMHAESQAISQTFDEWCDELGYDNDKISHKEIYDICRKDGKNFIKIFDIDEVSAFLEEKGYF